MTARRSESLKPGQRVRTPLGPGRIVQYRRAARDDVVPAHGKPQRGIAFAVVELDRGGSRYYPARELEALDSR